jgi:RNA polymerase sigma-70 factor (ECF subfamily)
MTQAALASPFDSPFDLSHELDALFAPLLRSAEAPPAEVRKAAAPAAADPVEDGTLCAWVTRIAAQDERALELLYDATVARVYGMARGITHNLQCAEEVTEDVYWQVWRQALRFDRQRGPVMAWLLTLARSRALDHLRRRDEAASHPEPHTLTDDEGDPHDNPAELLADADRAAALERALEQLDPLPRQLLSLAFYRGLTHDEIAAQTHLPLGTVKSHIRRGLAALRGLLQGNDAAAGAPASIDA